MKLTTVTLTNTLLKKGKHPKLTVDVLATIKNNKLTRLYYIADTGEQVDIIFSNVLPDSVNYIRIPNISIKFYNGMITATFANGVTCFFKSIHYLLASDYFHKTELLAFTDHREMTCH